MDTKNNEYLKQSALWIIGISTLLSYALLACMVFTSCSRVQEKGATSIQALQLLERAASESIESVVSTQTIKCAKEHGEFEGEGFESCMQSAWNMKHKYKKYVQPSVASSIIAASAALSLEKDHWIVYVKQGVCVITKLFGEWKHLIPYSENVQPIMQTLQNISCGEEKEK
jgi:hypothetical protein